MSTNHIAYTYVHDTGVGLDDQEKLEQIQYWCEKFGWTMSVHQNDKGIDILTITSDDATAEGDIKDAIGYLVKGTM